MRVWLALGFLAAFVSAHPARAEDQDPWCRNGSFPTDQASFGLAKVVGAPRTYLHDCARWADGCTAGGRTPYVVPGDVVLTGKSDAGQVCVFLPNRVGGSAGWVSRSEIAPLPNAAPSLADWSGRWTEGDDVIRLTVRGGKVEARGSACWPSCHPSVRDRPGGPNLGELSGSAAPQGAALIISEGSDPTDCLAVMQLVGPYLVVKDNNACGGMNVTFSGVYRREAKPPSP